MQTVWWSADRMRFWCCSVNAVVLCLGHVVKPRSRGGEAQSGGLDNLWTDDQARWPGPRDGRRIQWW